MAQNQIYKKIQREVRVDLLQAFDRNFERKSFFGLPWPGSQIPNRRGSMMMRTGKLRRSIAGNIQGQNIKFRSSLPYASIHNEGGEITVTQKMKSFFWAMYYKSAGASGRASGERRGALNDEAKFWKAMAMKRVGSKIKIPRRRFIGPHPGVTKIIKSSVDRNLEQIKNQIDKNFKR